MRVKGEGCEAAAATTARDVELLQKRGLSQEDRSLPLTDPPFVTAGNTPPPASRVPGADTGCADCTTARWRLSGHPEWRVET